MDDPLREKVGRLLQSLVGERADRLAAGKLHRDVIQRIQQAHLDLGADEASRLGMHMSDWVGDAAFVMALHLFPEEFSDEEIRAGVEAEPAAAVGRRFRTRRVPGGEPAC